MIAEATQDKFDSTWRKLCTVEEVGADYVRPMIQQHYLGKWPGINTCNLVMFAGAFAVGMVVFADAPLQTSTRYGGKTWELARLWVSDSVPRNGETWLIGKAIRHVARNYPDVVCLVSYADPSVGHVGTIYKASNWTFDGMTETRKTPRCDYVDETGKKYSRAGHIPEGTKVERVPRVSKYRYFFRLHQETHV